MGGHGSPAGSVDSLVLEILDAIEEHGGSLDPVILHDHVDTEALAAVIDSLDGRFMVSFEVEGVEITVSEDGIFSRPRRE